MTHPDADDPYWDGAILGEPAERLRVPTGLITGWHDGLGDQTFEQYARLRQAGCETSFSSAPRHTPPPSSRAGPSAPPRASPGCVRICAPTRPCSATTVRVHVGGEEAWCDLDDWPQAPDTAALTPPRTGRSPGRRRHPQRGVFRYTQTTHTFRGRASALPRRRLPGRQRTGGTGGRPDVHHPAAGRTRRGPRSGLRAAADLHRHRPRRRLRPPLRRRHGQPVPQRLRRAGPLRTGGQDPAQVSCPWAPPPTTSPRDTAFASRSAEAPMRASPECRHRGSGGRRHRPPPAHITLHTGSALALPRGGRIPATTRRRATARRRRRRGATPRSEAAAPGWRPSPVPPGLTLRLSPPRSASMAARPATSGYLPVKHQESSAPASDVSAEGNPMARPVHFEIYANDFVRMRTFYESVFGWSFVQQGGRWAIRTGTADHGIDGSMLERVDPSTAATPAAGSCCACGWTTSTRRRGPSRTTGA